MFLSLFSGKKILFNPVNTIHTHGTEATTESWTLLVTVQGDTADHFYQRLKIEEFFSAFE